MRTAVQRATISLFLSVVSGSYAFLPPASSSREIFSQTKVREALHQTSLNLIPGQGAQLAVASCKEYVARDEDKSLDEEDKIVKTGSALSAIGNAIHSPNSSARTFLSRIFRTKSYQEPDLSEWKKFHSTNELIEKVKDEGDIVYFPICGFQWVSIDNDDGLKSYEVVPTIHSIHAACSLARRRPLTESIHGWYSPVCRLGNLDESDWEYCMEH